MEDNQVQANQVELTEAAVAENSAEDIHAAMFYMYLPKFKQFLNHKDMSRKKLVRLITALVEVPLNEKDYNPGTKIEKDTFLIGEKLFQSKTAMILHTLYEQELQNQMLQNERKEENAKETNASQE